ncbi:MAG: glycoside hydrolase family 3 C-terminal domain-containing protein [Verrucomicrobia bacterium]|nr:glycoside hydrolase family 3 C-terminal domain-containing protein [Verrucomicrobiota bacterium]
MEPITDASPRVEKIIKEMTTEEKIDFIGGWNGFYVRPIPRLSVPELKMSDGPLGMRGDTPAVSYPAGMATAACWDTALAERYGKELGRDARARGVHIILGPSMNICRAPMCGRNFEYLGEDPFHVAQVAVAIIKGIQGQNVVATAKHFIANDQEWNRFQVSANVDERTLREIYFPPFEAAVKGAQVGAMMTSYNMLNGEFTPQNEWLISEIAKKEWQFQGFVMSDWNSVNDGLAAAHAGLDIEMPFAMYMNRPTLLKALQEGKITIQTIDDKIRRILNTADRFGFFDRPQKDYGISQLNSEGQKVALEIAQNGIVLLKNDNSFLPLSQANVKNIAVIGPKAAQIIPQGGGSSKVTPICQGSFLKGIQDHVGENVNVFYARGVPDLTQGYYEEAWDNKKFFLSDPDPRKQQFGFNAEYFNNIDLSGPPALTRLDPTINFKWRELSYVQNGPVNHYSARWTTYFFAPVDLHGTFYISGGDGYRLKINGQLIVERWHNPNGEPFTWHPMFFEMGKIYQIVLECYLDYGGQEFQFTMVPGSYTALDDAKEVALRADAVVLCVGLDTLQEGESLDRSFVLPEAQNQLIRTVLQANPKTAVVLTGGGNVDMSSWINGAGAVLQTWYPGQEGGKALAQILFGDVNPSGKLPVTFEEKLADNPTSISKSYYDTKSDSFPNGNKQVDYSEKLLTGYRYYTTKPESKQPLFPFGHGLSYTKFSYSDIQVERLSLQDPTQLKVSFNIQNDGDRDGSEVAQLYINQVRLPRVTRPQIELKGFAKVKLKAGETQRVSILLDQRSFSYYDVATHQWEYDPGLFKIFVGPSSAKLTLVAEQILPVKRKEGCTIS